MKNLEKLKIIESNIVPKKGVKIETMGTSVKITHTCGCVLVQHFAGGKPNMSREVNPELYDRIDAEKSYFIELCEEHISIMLQAE